jgi:hypothetical protein
MAHTHNQELESRFNTLQSGLLETQQEVQQLSATIASRDASMNASVNVIMQSAMAEVKHELTTQLESVFASLCTKLKLSTDDSFLRHIKRLKVKLLPIPFNPITFKGTYAFRGWM